VFFVSYAKSLLIVITEANMPTNDEAVASCWCIHLSCGVRFNSSRYQRKCSHPQWLSPFGLFIILGTALGVWRDLGRFQQGKLMRSHYYLGVSLRVSRVMPWICRRLSGSLSFFHWCINRRLQFSRWTKAYQNAI